jgi:hypothetical protein
MGRLATAAVAVVALCSNLHVASAQLTAEDETKPTFVVPLNQRASADGALRILVYGDMRFTDPRNKTDTAPRVRAWLAQKVGEEKPDAMLVTGDIPFHGGDPADWVEYQKETASWTQNHLRVYPTVGNHEVVPDAESGYVNYFKAFPELHGYHVYSVLIGNVFVMSLNSTEPIWPTGYQAEWIRNQVEHIPPQADFVFFLVHIPLIADVQTEFIAGVPSPELIKLRSYLESRAATSHAKFIVVSGHIHNYERFERNGITHIISGGGGAKPYPVFMAGDEDFYRDNLASPNFNYMVFTIKGGHADARMYRVVDPNATQLDVKQSDSFSLDASRTDSHVDSHPPTK